MDSAVADLHAEKRGHAGIIVLDRPRARNALTTGMVDAMTKSLEDFQDDDAVSCVVLMSAVEGTFCAGGDVRAVRHARLEGRHELADAFFEREFALNALIARFPKPYLSLIDGTCFGGGMGITIHGWHRVVGEAALLAMPEAAIGYFPDVGSSHFLNRLPIHLARFLALTGHVLSPQDAVSTGLATKFVPARHHAEIVERLVSGERVEIVLDELAADPGQGRLAGNLDLVERCFAAGSITEIKAALRKESGALALEALTQLEKAAPSSLAVTMDLLNRTIGKSLTECLAIELDLAKRITHGRDFAEGIRALLIDKDRNPQWAPVEERLVS